MVLAAALLCAAAAGRGVAQEAAPATEHFTRVWHFGRVIGDLPRSIAFYQGVLGLPLQGPGPPQLKFAAYAALDEFVAAPQGAQFRAVHFVLPGAVAVADPAAGATLEAFEFRGIDRRQI